VCKIEKNGTIEFEKVKEEENENQASEENLSACNVGPESR
jgi:hypothetical protein